MRDWSNRLAAFVVIHLRKRVSVASSSLASAHFSENGQTNSRTDISLTQSAVDVLHGQTLIEHVCLKTRFGSFVAARTFRLHLRDIGCEDEYIETGE